MSGNTFGKLFRVTTWGESHGPALGAVVDGVPAGLPLNNEDIQIYLDRRKPGQNAFTTARSEGDLVEILSGVFEGKTTGTPISMMIRNTDQRSRDYSQIKDCYRPGHADLTFDKKYGFRDYRGGGRSSGRETAGRVCGGAVALKVLNTLGIQVNAWTHSIGPFACDPAASDMSRVKSSPLYMPDEGNERRAIAYLEQLRKENDSAGGTVKCVIRNLPAGIGEPVFDKLDALLGQSMFSIGAVKAVEIGDGVLASQATGSSNNDVFGSDTAAAGSAAATDNADGRSGSVTADNADGRSGSVTADNADGRSGSLTDDNADGRSGSLTDDNADGHSGSLTDDNADGHSPASAAGSADMTTGSTAAPRKLTNHAGGILGGMSDGSDVCITVHFKPTPSIAKPQPMLHRDGSVSEEIIHGRHDPVIVPRAVVVVECMAAITLLDLLLQNRTARMDQLLTEF